jgi:1,4-alpha-glucan branching enzyme
MKFKTLYFVFSVFSGFPLFSQILDVTPAFPTVNDIVTVVYDSKEGNATLNNTSTIYAHSGLITSASTSPTNWLFVQGNWGTADPNVLMSNLGNGLHSITIDIDQFYGFPANTDVQQLAFVFRNATGSIVGRESDGSDIFYPVYPTNSGLLCKFFKPMSSPLVNVGDTLKIIGKSNQNCSLTLMDNGTIVSNQNSSSVIQYQFPVSVSGTHLLTLTATNGTQTFVDSMYYFVNPPVNIQNPPAVYKNGLTIINDSTIFLKFFAPYKNHVYVIGDFNNFLPFGNYHMNLSQDSSTWWLEISGLPSGVKIGYQYLVDGALRIADPYSTLVADPNNDNVISTTIYPNKYVYPTGKTSGFVSFFELGKIPYNWQHPSINKPEKKNLIIYELLVRDFVSTHSYKTLTDTLNYLAKLGVNAIELMPVAEFENNESWGYNPSFHMALDKYYGTPEDLKEFVDSCHGRGIAVILDVVYNHAFGLNPMVNMYWNSVLSQPSAQNPWFNTTCPHPPYCWGYDFNHSAPATQSYVDQLNRYWIEEFKVDGYRFDFTKGFDNGNNNYSTSRINILKRMADSLWAFDSTAYIILEHWSDNNEEKILSDYGMMLWGNIIYPWHESLKGNNGNINISSGVYTNRGWTFPHLITYKESHDEQRSMYECITNGNMANPSHNVKSLNVALQRCQAAAAIQLLTPGPKMLWQFEELGYDIDINFPCRVCNKPILWNYATQFSRNELYKVYRSVLNLRKTVPIFQSLNFDYAFTGDVKRVRFDEPFEKAIIIANFDNYPASAYPVFHQAGTWYEYFSGDSLNVTNTTMQITLAPGEYRIYTTLKHNALENISPVSIEQIEADFSEAKVFPIPATDVLTLEVISSSTEKIELILLSQDGKEVSKKMVEVAYGKNGIDWDVSNISSGIYFVIFKGEKSFLGHKEIIIHRN